MPRRVLLIMTFILVPTLLFSGITGKIAGVVKDKDTGDPLAGANILLEGTTLGAAADMNGYFFIINIPPGKYRVRVTMMGYQPMVQTDVQVIVDRTTTVNFELSSTVLAGEAVEIVAERPLIESDVTASQTVATGEQIDQMPVNTYSEVLVTAPGFVESGTGLNRDFNVRGGRQGELSYMIDGFYVEDPLMGGAGSDVANVGIAELAIMTGTFNAEYGEAMSGVLNIVTKEGGGNYNGRIRFRTDKYVNPHKFEYLYKHLRDGKDWIVKEGVEDIGTVTDVGTQPVIPGQNKNNERYWERKEESVTDFNTYRPDFYFGGPIPFLSRGNTFFIAGDYLDTDTYLGWTGMPYQKERRANAKLILKPTQSMKLVLGAVYGTSKYKNYDHSYKYIPDHLGTNYDDNYMMNFTFTHTLSPSTFYTLRGSRFNSHRNYYLYPQDEFFSERDADGEWHLLSYNPDTGEYDGPYTGAAERIQRDEEYEFWNGWWVYDEDTGDSTWHTGGGPEWEDRKNIITTAKFDITSQATRIHQFKAGFELKQVDIKYWDIYAPYSPPPIFAEHYEHKPIEGSAYIQDKMEFEDWGMVINAGVRMDYMDTKAKYYVDTSNPIGSELKDADKKMYLSPRLGFAHPITDRAVLHFAYGHFYQVPQYQYLYRLENIDYEGYPYPNMLVDEIYTQAGNANLKPQKTITYEAGVETRLTENMSVDLTLYYKDIYDYVAYRRYRAAPVDYHRISNFDYGNAKGVEIKLDKRFSNHFGGTFNYTYSRAEGNAADVTAHWDDWYSFSVYHTYPPNKTILMDWDQTHTFNFILTVADPGNWNVNVTGNFGSGLPYTPLSSRGIRIDEPNSARMPWTMNVNLRASKQFDLFGLETMLFADLINVLGKRNVLSVWGNTGEPDHTNDWDDTQDFIKRPHMIGPPRILELGLSIGFR